MKKLQEIWNELPLKTDKGSVHSYLPVYEEILAPYRKKNILEIGLFNGASLLMWEQYFSGKVYGIDCHRRPHDGMADLGPLIKQGTHNILIFDAEDEDQVDLYLKGVSFDVIIDDAGHHVEQQLRLYKVFKPYLNKDGIYIIEDIQNIDKDSDIFLNIDPQKKVSIVDLRGIKNRYDDVLCIIK